MVNNETEPTNPVTKKEALEIVNEHINRPGIIDLPLFMAFVGGLFHAGVCSNIFSLAATRCV